MNGTPVQRLAWWLLVAIFVVGMAISMASTLTFSSNDLVVVSFAAYTVVGAVVAARRPENPIGWIFLSTGALTGLAGAAGAGARLAYAQPPPTPWWGTLSAWVQTWYWYPLFMLASTFTVLLYPSGLPSPRWRPLLWLTVFCTVATTTLAALQPTLTLALSDSPAPGEGRTIVNPLSPGFMAGIDDMESWWPLNALILLALGAGAAAVVSAGLRTWRSRGVERLQMRLFVFAFAILFLVMVASGMNPGFGNAWAGGIAFAAALTMIPVSCGIAILRYRLYDIDRIIGRTTAYAIVTGLLLAVYALVVTSVTRLLPGTSNAFAVAAATLAAAALFRPLLSRVQAFVDRRFNRTRYDAQRTVEAFASRLRDQVDPDDVSADLLTVLRQTVQPRAAGLWLRERRS